jgi:DNA-binding Lrp family transcriptional regulator
MLDDRSVSVKTRSNNIAFRQADMARLTREVRTLTSIDKLDVKILGALTVNARAGIAELSTALGVSRNTVQTRINRLEQSGILIGFRPIINLANIDMPVQALVSIEMDQRLLPAIVQGLAKLPEVLEVKTQAGREDLLVHVAISSLEALQVLTSAMVDIDGVRKTISTISVSTPIQFRVQPLLEHIASDAGWGRSTPAPDPQS